MFCGKSVNGVIILFFAMLIGMYGCTSQQNQVVMDKMSIGRERPKYTVPADREETISLRSADEYSTGAGSSSVISIRKIVPSQSLSGRAIDVVINVTNLSDSTVNDIEVFETIPQKFDVKSSEPLMKGDVLSGRAHWLLGDLGPGETKVIRVSGTPAALGVLEFCCTDVAYKLPLNICKTTNVVQPELMITKQIPSDVIICDPIPIKIVVTNTGTGTAQNVKIKEPLPSGMKSQRGEDYVEYDVGSLQSGESREVVFNVKAGRTGTFDNSATVVADDGLSANSNTTTTVVSQPVLSITKTGPAIRYIGRNITYNIVVTNEGNGPSINTVVDDSIPTNTSMVRAGDGGTVTGKGVLWHLGTLQPRESREVSVTVRADSLGKAENCVVVSGECADAVKDCAVTEVVGISAILLEVVDIQDPIEIGASETYEIAVTNQGSATGTNITIACTLEAGTMEYISSDGPTAGSSVGNRVIFEPLPALGPKERAIWRINVKAVGKGDVRFKATLNSDQIDRAVEETESTNFYQ